MQSISSSREEVADRNERHNKPLGEKDINRLMDLLHGHPYLVRRALYLISSDRLSVAELFEKALDDRGPFGDHLRYHLFRLHGKDDLIDGLRRIIRENKCADDRIFFRLRGAGIIRAEGLKVVPRCQLYADYLIEHLNGR